MTPNSLRILFIGDIFGRPGRDAVESALPELRETYRPDMVIANCENAAGGKGVTEKIVDDLFSWGIDVLTGGNHSFHQRGSEHLFERNERLIRPANFPPGTPGNGSVIRSINNQHRVGVINVCGRAFMEHFDDFFRSVDEHIEAIRQTTPIIIVDFHAEATSEKVALGWYLDGRVSAVLGTHTHIPTADESILPGGTAHISDVGMTGPYESVIGSEINGVLLAMRSMRFRRFEVAPPHDVRLCGVVVDIDPATGAATHIERVRRDLGRM